ncbi:MAG: hypothetical protein ABIN01_06570 [Ferruginibacter sp.]
MLYYKQVEEASSTTNFHHLSVKDLIEARDTFHVHLMNKRNVIATAISRYRIRLADFKTVGGDKIYSPSKKYPKGPRTLENSIVTEFSWPCVLVFVKKWEDESSLINDGGDNIIPKSIYMPDGKIVPICVVEAPKSVKADTFINERTLNFPINMISGGFPLIVQSQGERRIASVGCLVSDGNKVYALTNKHVAGKEGTEIFSLFNGIEKRIGVSSNKQLGRGKFMDMYPGFVGKNLVINQDVGLVEIDDLSIWKTEVLGFGQIHELKDLNTFNISLELITKKVFAFGAVSKVIEGQIAGLFYRYKAVGGTEYIADYLIGGIDGGMLNTHHGDSGTLWMVEDEDDEKNKILRPFALHWGQHEFMEGDKKRKRTFAMATSLSNICRELDVDLLRGWNLDQDYSWGKTGHFKVGARACDLVKNKNLLKLLQANKFNIGYSDEDLNTPANLVKGGSREFTPLADVADLVWRGMKGNAGVARVTDESNHFADMDEKHPLVMNNESLFDLCFKSNGAINEDFVDKEKWLQFYDRMDDENPEIGSDGNQRPRLGGLPFRVWQMYDIMVNALKQGKVDEFVCAGGTMAHYVGDASQCLHLSFMHHGLGKDDKKVHADYEDRMIVNKVNRQKLFAGINAFNKKVKASQLITGGKGAAIVTLKLMRQTFNTLSPDTVINAWRQSVDMEDLFEKVGKETITNITNSCLTMAIIWQSAWKEGKGDQVNQNKLVAISKERLIELYEDKNFVRSFTLDKLILQ